jgi:DNA polymerase elongation subunit (family B)
MLEHLKIGNLLFLDIETVPAFPSYPDVPDALRLLWDKKATYLKKETETPEMVYQRAGIYAEFGRIVCISTGMIGTLDDKRVLRLKSYFAETEGELLKEFADLIVRLCQKKEIDLCAHNGREFDFPYMARRMLINGVQLPEIFDNAGKRPWEVRYVDTLELWKFGDHKHYTSLDLLASLFGIESPKTELDGSQVSHVYWQQNDIRRIVDYCRKDVVTTAQIMLRFKGEPLLEPSDVLILDEI